MAKPTFSNQFYLAISLITLSFAGFEAYINFHLRAVNDSALAACVKPAQPSKWEAVFYVPAKGR